MTMNEIISAYIKAKEAEKEAKKQADLLKGFILEKAGNNPLFETDSFTVIIKTTESIRLDTKALYKDFPDIKETYGSKSTTHTITVAEKIPELKTA